MSDTNHPRTDSETRAEPIFNGLAGESLQAFVDRRVAEFGRFMDANPNWTPGRFISVQNLANRSSDGRY